jgi:hypothetical protein
LKNVLLRGSNSRLLEIIVAKPGPAGSFNSQLAPAPTTNVVFLVITGPISPVTVGATSDPIAVGSV